MCANFKTFDRKITGLTKIIPTLWKPIYNKWHATFKKIEKTTFKYEKSYRYLILETKSKDYISLFRRGN